MTLEFSPFMAGYFLAFLDIPAPSAVFTIASIILPTSKLLDPIIIIVMIPEYRRSILKFCERRDFSLNSGTPCNQGTSGSRGWIKIFYLLSACCLRGSLSTWRYAAQGCCFYCKKARSRLKESLWSQRGLFQPGWLLWDTVRNFAFFPSFIQ